MRISSFVHTYCRFLLFPYTVSFLQSTSQSDGSSCSIFNVFISVCVFCIDVVVNLFMCDTGFAMYAVSHIPCSFNSILLFLASFTLFNL